MGEIVNYTILMVLHAVAIGFDTLAIKMELTGLKNSMAHESTTTHKVLIVLYALAIIFFLFAMIGYTIDFFQ